VLDQDKYVFDPDDKCRSLGHRDEPLPDAEIPVVAYDFGIKFNIMRRLPPAGMRVTVVPAKRQSPRCSP
jgi:carbamoyl-phosphate synthase small subunit